jgi:signal transduction histidine kinase
LSGTRKLLVTQCAARYRCGMDTSATPESNIGSARDTKPGATLLGELRRIYAWARLRVVLAICGIWIALFSLSWETAYWILICRLLFLGFACLTAFGLCEVWPRRLPQWFARWALQVIAVAVAVPIAVLLGYHFTTLDLNPPWWRDSKRLEGAATFIFLGLIIAPWTAVAALLKQIKEEAYQQALRFDLERSEMERNALNARLSLLASQVQPHFLFNTLANIRELVIASSPQAPAVLDNLIAYLRAAVPRLNDERSTLTDEIERTRAYLELMQMRMPDRLRYEINAPDALTTFTFPSMSLLTLVENAIRHGIDPSEQGGHIQIRVARVDGWLEAEVTDTGVGMHHQSAKVEGLGTGIANLRERLRIALGNEATVELVPNVPRGTRAIMRWRVGSNELSPRAQT